MTTSTVPTKLKEWMDQAYDEATPMRTLRGQPEQVEQRNAVAVALLDLAEALWETRQDWMGPHYQWLARLWWREHCTLPVKESLALHEALKLNGVTPPALSFE